MPANKIILIIITADIKICKINFLSLCFEKFIYSKKLINATSKPSIGKT